MKRPLLFMTMSFILGIITFRYSDYLILFISLFFVSSIILYNKTRWMGILCFPFFFLLGFFLCSKTLNFNSVYENKEIQIKGIVTDVSSTKNGYPKIILKTDNFNILCYLDKKEKVSVADVIKIKGEFLVPDEKRNPGGFNEKMYYYNKNIRYKTFATIEKRDYPKDNFYKNLFLIRQKFMSTFDNSLPEKESGILKAMIFGDRTNLDEEIKNFYISGGIYHIIAISGLHISVLLILLESFFYKFLNRRFSAILISTILISFLIIIGFPASATRAVIMALVMLLGNIVFRERDLLTTLSFSSLLILIYNPLYIWDVGFQLSFGAVLGIAIGKEPIIRLINSLGKYKKLSRILSHQKIIETLAIFISVNIITIPVSMYFFYYFYPYSFLTNILILPTTTLLVSLGFILGILGAFIPPLKFFISGGIFYILKYYEFLCRFIDSLPFSKILTGSPKPLFLFMYIFITILLLKLLNSVKDNFNKYVKMFKITLSIFFIIILVNQIIPKGFELTMLDVGQGDGMVFSYKNKTFLIDTGENSYETLDFLNYKGIKELDGIFLSHTDSDHSGGFSDIVNEKIVHNVFMPDRNYEGDDFLKNLANENINNKVQFIKSGDIIYVGENLKILCVYPYSGYSSDSNNGSMVLKLSLKGVSFLFTGDIEASAESDILESSFNIKSDVLKVSHHGSDTSSGESFINKISPQISLISVGKNNSYGHPGKNALNNLEGSLVYRTDLDGAILLKTDGKRIYIKKMIN